MHDIWDYIMNTKYFDFYILRCLVTLFFAIIYCIIGGIVAAIYNKYDKTLDSPMLLGMFWPIIVIFIFIMSPFIIGYYTHKKIYGYLIKND